MIKRNMNGILFLAKVGTDTPYRYNALLTGKNLFAKMCSEAKPSKLLAIPL
jgi:hypothetical protein